MRVLQKYTPGEWKCGWHFFSPGSFARPADCFTRITLWTYDPHCSFKPNMKRLQVEHCSLARYRCRSYLARIVSIGRSVTCIGTQVCAGVRRRQVLGRQVNCREGDNVRYKYTSDTNFGWFWTIFFKSCLFNLSQARHLFKMVYIVYF